MDSQLLPLFCLLILCMCVGATRESVSLLDCVPSGESKGICEGSYLCV